MMALGLRDGPNLIRKRQGLREVLERVEPLQMPSPVKPPSLAELFQQLPFAESLQRWHTGFSATSLVCQFHRKLSSIAFVIAFT